MSNRILLLLRVVVALILFQTLRYKFGAHPDSVFIFSEVGMEPNGRIGVGVMELIAGLLILFPKTIWLGAGLTLGIIGGAILMHLTILGIEVQGDNGSLFYTALLTFLLSGMILWNYKTDIPLIGERFLNKS